MGTRDGYDAGTFSWAELATTDGPAAKEFYGKVFGWEYDDNEIGDGAVYSMAKVDGAHVGAIFQADGPARWNSYVTVDDVEEATKKAKDAGANVHAEPFDVMDAGRMSVIQDPTGGVVSLWEAKDHIGAGLVNAHGALTWNDLMTTDVAKAAGFYAELFGWEVAPVDMEGKPVEPEEEDEDSDDSEDGEDSEDSGGDGDGIHVDPNDATDAPGVDEDGSDEHDDDDEADDDEDEEDEEDDDSAEDDSGEDDEPSAADGGETPDVGEYERVTIKNGDRLNGGIAKLPEGAGDEVPPHWLPYFAVDSVDAAVSAARDGGGEAMSDPLDVPQGRLAVLIDPQGAVFAVFEGEFDD